MSVVVDKLHDKPAVSSSQRGGTAVGSPRGKHQLSNMMSTCILILIVHDLRQSTIGTKFMKLQGTTSEKGEKEQETKGKGTHTARAGRDDGRGWEDDLPQAEERKGA